VSHKRCIQQNPLCCCCCCPCCCRCCSALEQRRKDGHTRCAIYIVQPLTIAATRGQSPVEGRNKLHICARARKVHINAPVVATVLACSCAYGCSVTLMHPQLRTCAAGCILDVGEAAGCGLLGRRVYKTHNILWRALGCCGPPHLQSRIKQKQQLPAASGPQVLTYATAMALCCRHGCCPSREDCTCSW
jgi:hypothetical protein